MGITKKELADTLGVSKQTVVNYIDRLELSPDHVSRVGKYDVLDDFAVSAIADNYIDPTTRPIPNRKRAPDIPVGWSRFRHRFHHRPHERQVT